jgi:predicted glycogen debranching enzyme
MTSAFVSRPESYQQATAREWLVCNGLGGYASSTLCASNTRAYHGLLVAALRPPADRWLLLSSLDEEIDGVSLASHQYPGVVHPQGFEHLKEYREDPFPRLCYQIGDTRIEKTVFMIRGENTTIIIYRIFGGRGHLRIVPLVHCRSFHAASGLPPLSQHQLAAGTAIRSAGQPEISLSLLSDGPKYQQEGRIYYNFEYEEERRRGLAWREDLFAPGSFEMDLSNDSAFAISASTWRSSMPNWRPEMIKENSRLADLRSPLPELTKAADSFIVKRGGSTSIIAGYHWFDDWGRDAMISLPGLLLCTRRLEEAKNVIRSFAAEMKGGVLPNDLGARSYNTVDASLWFVRSAAACYDRSRDQGFLKEIWPAMLEVFRRYSGTGEGFGSDDDALVFSGPALTWMDARLEGRPVTTRAGKCCEINALWYSALREMNRMQKALGSDKGSEKPEFSSLAEKVKKSYSRFWNSETLCLYDVIDHEDASIRPNQIIAAGVDGLLPYFMREAILEVVTGDLLTPYGLRTLSPRDPRYIGRYEGDPKSRDGAYHQGTVWPWLMGPYIEALLSVRGRSKKVRSHARELLRPLLEVQAGAVGSLPEVFDGNRAQRPGGCISQAWSVAEVLRAWEMTE